MNILLELIIREDLWSFQMFFCICKSIYIYTFKNEFYVCVCVCMRERERDCEEERERVCVCVCVNLHTCTYAYVHTPICPYIFMVVYPPPLSLSSYTHVYTNVHLRKHIPFFQ